MMDAILLEADKRGVSPALACAIVHQLSQWLPATINHAPDSILPNFDLPVEELNGQQTTYGLLQFTGQQARNAGFKGQFAELIDPDLNVTLGMEILAEALRLTSKREVGLIIYLGRSRANIVPSIVSMIHPYEELIAKRMK